MVSGLVTSPCDQLRIFSGDARLMRMASKSAIGFAMSKGLERYKVILRFLRVLTCPLTALHPVASRRSLVASETLGNWTAQEPNRPPLILQSCLARTAVSRRRPTTDAGFSIRRCHRRHGRDRLLLADRRLD